MQPRLTTTDASSTTTGSQPDPPLVSDLAPLGGSCELQPEEYESLAVPPHGCAAARDSLAGAPHVSGSGEEGGDGSDDPELRHAIETHEEHQRRRERKESDIAMLEAMSRELQGWASGDGDLGENEYFDLGNFTRAAEQCWLERKQSDAAGMSRSTVKLFPSESAILAQRALRARMAEDRSLQDEHELGLRHPLMYRRMKRNRDRRAHFEAALAEYHRGGTVTVAGEGGGGGGGGGGGRSTTLALSERSPTTGSYSVQRDMNPPFVSPQRPFACGASFDPQKHAQLSVARAQKIKRESLGAASSSSSGGGGGNGELMGMSGASAPDGAFSNSERDESLASVPPSQASATEPLSSKQTLAALLQEQATLMAKAAEHDELVYRPILAACAQYEKQAHRRLEMLSGIIDGCSAEAGDALVTAAPAA